MNTQRRLMRDLAAVFLATFVMGIGVANADMVALDADELTDISAQDGISFEWDLRINADATGNLDTALCPPANRVQCRIAINWANRGTGASTEWVVWKGFSGRIYMPRFNLSSFRSPASGTPYASVGAGGRFVNGFGVPVSPYSKPGLSLTFPEDIQLFQYKIAAMGIEYGDGLTAGSGFQADPTDAKSFLGIQITNSIAGQPGVLKVEGAITIFGF